MEGNKDEDLVGKTNQNTSVATSITEKTTKGGGKRDFFLQGVDCRSYTIFELDLLFEKTRLRFVDSGSALEEYSINNVAADCGIRNLGRPRVTATSARKALYFAADNMHRHLSKGETLKCSFNDGVKTLAACKVIQNAGKG